MERIASFCIDHDVLVPGMYISRIDGDVVTYDIRFKRPNGGGLSVGCGTAHRRASVCHLCAQQRRVAAGDLCWPDGLPHRLLSAATRYRFGRAGPRACVRCDGFYRRLHGAYPRRDPHRMRQLPLAKSARRTTGGSRYAARFACTGTIL